MDEEGQREGEREGVMGVLEHSDEGGEDLRR